MARILFDRMWEQKNAVEKEYGLKKRNYERQQRLIAGEVISTIDLEKAESEMLGKESELNRMRSDLAQKQIDLRELEQDMIENNKTYPGFKKQAPVGAA